MANTPSNYAVPEGKVPGLNGYSSAKTILPSRKLYRTIAKEHPDRVVMLCDRAHVLARSDRPAQCWIDLAANVTKLPELLNALYALTSVRALAIP